MTAVDLRRFCHIFSDLSATGQPAEQKNMRACADKHCKGQGMLGHLPQIRNSSEWSGDEL